MAQRFSNLLGALKQQRGLRQWARAAENVHKLEPRDLRELDGQAKGLRKQLDVISREASAVLRGPRIGKDIIDTPPQCDWAWRPELWRTELSTPGRVGLQPAAELGEGLKLFHDCPLAELSFRQHRNHARDAHAPYGVALDVLGFEGGFLSLVFDLPEHGRNTTNRSHIVCLNGQMSTETPIEIYARLNVKHGPNTEQFVSELRLENGRFAAEFDLGHAEVNEKRLENIWLDLIFDKPQMNRIVIDDLTLARRPRAEL